MRLIEHSFVSQLQGQAKLTFEPSGVVCVLAIPIASLNPRHSRGRTGALGCLRRRAF